MERVYRMRAVRCERDVLDRLRSIEQVRTASIDTEQSTIEYLSFDGTTHGTQSFPMGTKVGDIVLTMKRTVSYTHLTLPTIYSV